MSRKITLSPKHFVVAGDMSASITSTPLIIQQEDSVAIQLNFTGTPTGTFQVQGSLDYVPPQPNFADQPTATGNWVNLTLSPVPIAAGAPDNILIDLYALSFPYIRLVYTRTSGSGTLEAYVSCKALGS